MCEWEKLNGKRVRVRCHFAALSPHHEQWRALVKDIEIYNYVTGAWEYARDHVYLPPRRHWRGMIAPGDIIEFTGKIDVYHTVNNPERRLSFKSITDICIHRGEEVQP